MVCAVLPKPTQRIAHLGSGERFAGAEHPDGSFPLEGRTSTLGAQRYPVTFQRDSESVPGSEVQLVPEGFRQNHASCLIESHCDIHKCHYIMGYTIM